MKLVNLISVGRSISEGVGMRMESTSSIKSKSMAECELFSKNNLSV